MVDEEGHLVGAVATTEDMGEIRRLQDQASELADHLLLALAAGELGTWRWDMATGVTTWDAPMSRVFGLPEGGFDGTYDAWVALLHPDDRDDVLAVLDGAIATKGSYQVDHRVIWPDGSVHWLQGRGKVTVDERGEVTGTIGCTADITVQKLAELDAERRAAASAAEADRERLRSERLAFLAEITQELVVATGHRDFMQRVVRRAVPHLGDWCAIVFFPEPGGAPEVEIGHSDPAMLEWSRNLADRIPYDPDARHGVAAVMRTGQTEYVPEITDEALIAAVADAGAGNPEQMLELLRSLHLTSTITVPLRTRRELIGAMQFVSAESGRQYTSEDVALATATSGRVADGLNNIWLAEQHRRISVTLQAALLPPHLPEIPGTTVAVRYWAAGAVPDVGGDFYDVFALGGSRWGVVIGDVCGTGPDAASLTGLARHTIRAAVRHGIDHDETLSWLNEAVLASNRDLFCTAVVATLAHAGDEWRFSSASGGHPFPVLIRASGETASVGTPGRLLGVFAEAKSSTCTVALEPGDTIVLYTDGVTDLPPPHGLDEAEVLRLATEAAAGAVDADEIADRLHYELERRLPIEQRTDDTAVVIIRIDA